MDYWSSINPADPRTWNVLLQHDKERQTNSTHPILRQGSEVDSIQNVLIAGCSEMYVKGKKPVSQNNERDKMKGKSQHHPDGILEKGLKDCSEKVGATIGLVILVSLILTFMFF